MAELTPVTRLEMFLAGEELDPVTRIEKFLAGEALVPVTRQEMYLAAMGGQSVDLPDPVTRLELFLAKAAGMSVETPDPVTRIEMFLSEWSGGSVELTATGNAPVTLANAIAHAIVSLTQEGKVTQASTPTPSSPVWPVCNNGTLRMVDDELPTGYKRVLGFTCDNNAVWEITDFHLQGADTVRISFSVNAGCNVFGCYQGADATDNYDLYVSTSSGSKYFRYGGGTYLSYWSPDDLEQRFDVVYTPTGSSGMPQDSTWSPLTFTSENNLLIGSTTLTGTSSKLKGDLYGNFVVDGRLKLIPCERVSDGVLGYYDTYSETFYEPYEGFDGAVSLGYDGSHYSLATVGTPEALSVLPCVAEGYAVLPYVAMDGEQKLATSITGIGSRVEITVQSTDTGTTGRGLCTYDSNYGGMHCYVRDGEDYSLTSAAQITGVARNKNLVKILFDTGSNSYNRATLTIGSQTITYTRNTARPTKNISFFGSLSSTAEAWVGKCWGIKIYTDSTNTLVYDGVPCIRLSDGKVGFYDTVGEAFTASSGSSDFIAGYETTASVADLFAVGDYKDTQEIIGGTVTRRVGFKVMTGNEFVFVDEDYGGNFHGFAIDANEFFGIDYNIFWELGGMQALTTHFSSPLPIPDLSYEEVPNNTAYWTNTSLMQNAFCFNHSGWQTAEDVQAFFAEQYVAGTPVIVPYPLAEETTEQVTPQALRTAEGTNTVSVTSNVDPVPLTVVYKGKESE